MNEDIALAQAEKRVLDCARDVVDLVRFLATLDEEIAPQTVMKARELMGQLLSDLEEARSWLFWLRR